MGGLDEGIRNCIAKVLAELEFDPPEGGAATVSGSFSFINANKTDWPWPVTVQREGHVNPP
jgi:hypothetical protein